MLTSFHAFLIMNNSLTAHRGMIYDQKEIFLTKKLNV